MHDMKFTSLYILVKPSHPIIIRLGKHPKRLYLRLEFQTKNNWLVIGKIVLKHCSRMPRGELTEVMDPTTFGKRIFVDNGKK